MGNLVGNEGAVAVTGGDGEERTGGGNPERIGRNFRAKWGWELEGTWRE